MILYNDNHFLYANVVKSLIFLEKIVIIDEIYDISILNINLQFCLIYKGFNDIDFVYIWHHINIIFLRITPKNIDFP